MPILERGVSLKMCRVKKFNSWKKFDGEDTTSRIRNKRSISNKGNPTGEDGDNERFCII